MTSGEGLSPELDVVLEVVPASAYVRTLSGCSSLDHEDFDVHLTVPEIVMKSTSKYVLPESS